MSQKPVETIGTFCDAPNCKDTKIILHGTRHRVVPFDFVIARFDDKGGKIDEIPVKKGDYHNGCLGNLFYSKVVSARKAEDGGK